MPDLRRIHRSIWLMGVVAAIAVSSLVGTGARVALATGQASGSSGSINQLEDPTEEPSAEASEEASEEPSDEPSEEPSEEPTEEPVDANGDGIADALQPGATAVRSFHDGPLAPPTTGSITSTAGLPLTIVDAANPSEGVRVMTGAGAPGTQAVLSVCSGFTLLVDADSSIIVTCGSVTIRVASGSADVVTGQGLVVVAFGPGGHGTVAALGGGAFTVSAAPSSSTLVLSIDGATTQIAAGETSGAKAWDFVGFTQPIDNAPVVNSVKAGQAVPVKWRSVDSAGVPIANLTAASLAFQSVSCASGSTVDVIEQTVAGASGLQNLGNGYYQLNWKSPKALAGACGTLRLSIGDGVTHDALFRFTK